MRKMVPIILLLVLAAFGLSGPGPVAAHFVAVDVFIDSGQTGLAAYQVDLVAHGHTKILSLEGGEHAAFSAAPYYDPAALADSAADTNHIILAAFSLNGPGDLPAGRTRVARLHLLVEGAEGSLPEISQKIIVATDASGDSIPATLTLQKFQGDKK